MTEKASGSAQAPVYKEDEAVVLVSRKEAEETPSGSAQEAVCSKYEDVDDTEMVSKSADGMMVDDADEADNDDVMKCTTDEELEAECGRWLRKIRGIKKDRDYLKDELKKRGVACTNAVLRVWIKKFGATADEPEPDNPP